MKYLRTNFRFSIWVLVGTLFSFSAVILEGEPHSSTQIFPGAASSSSSFANMPAISFLRFSNRSRYAGLYAPFTQNPETIRRIRHAAEAGNPEAAYLFGEMYLVGSREISRDEIEAKSWVRSAADQGYGPAQLLLGIMYDLGIGGGRTSKEALRWFMKAHAQHIPEAAFEIGLCYLEGKGVSENIEEATRYFEVAAQAGAKEAFLMLGILYEDGVGGPSKRLQARHIYLTLARSFYPMALAALGSLSEERGEKLKAFLFFDLAYEYRWAIPLRRLSTEKLIITRRKLLGRELSKQQLLFSNVRKAIWKTLARVLPEFWPLENLLLFELAI
ncbi:MAG: tetratricopeptide repeat protein [Candidatus Ozemobacteraceae bacterium]